MEIIGAKSKRQATLHNLNICTNAKREQSMQFVDIGLSVKSATCNLGASRPEEYGDYYTWGETKPRIGDSWDYIEENTPYYDSSKNWGSTKYGKYIRSDNKIILNSEDDASVTALGTPWRMPIEDEIKELIDMCTWTWTTMNGTNLTQSGRY